MLCPVVILYPTFEEIVFRGMVQNALQNNHDSKLYAILMTAMIFSFMHLTGKLEIVPVFQIFILSVVLSLLTFASTSLFPAIIMHAVYNFTELLLHYRYLN